MTLEERAKNLYVAVATESGNPTVQVRLIELALREAVAAEREACAKVTALEDIRSLQSDLRRIADAIPAGGLTRYSAEEEVLLRQAVVAAEREMCAKVAEEVEHVHPVFQQSGVPKNLREHIAAAIRARGDAKP